MAKRHSVNADARWLPDGSLWWHQQIADAPEWWVSVHFELAGEHLVVSEVELFPKTRQLKRLRLEEKLSPDAQKALARYDNPAVVPVGGITAQLMRKVRLGEITAAAQRHLQQTSAHVRSSGAPASSDYARKLAEAPIRTGRAGTDDLVFALWASRYVDRLADGSRSPIADLAETYGLKREAVRDAIHQARFRELLEQTSGGRSGGRLTSKAVHLLTDERGN